MLIALAFFSVREGSAADASMLVLCHGIHVACSDVCVSIEELLASTKRDGVYGDILSGSDTISSSAIVAFQGQLKAHGIYRFEGLELLVILAVRP